MGEGDSGGRRYVLVSTDCHAGADLRGYRPYLEARWHDEFDGWADGFFDLWGDIDPGTDYKAGVSSYLSPLNWDDAKRNEALEAEGIAAEVIFPNTVPPFFPVGLLAAPGPRTRDEYDRRWAGIRAHNRWLADFCDALPGRRFGIAQVFIDDLDDTLAEIRWAKEHGMRGILLPGDHHLKLHHLYYRKYDPIWALCTELDIPIGRHGAVVSSDEEEDSLAGAHACGVFETTYFAQRTLHQLIFSGVFDRHPSLKFTFTETGPGTWVTDQARVLDGFKRAALSPGSIAGMFARDAMVELRKDPSDYCRENVWVSSMFTGQDMPRRHEVGLDRLLWGADFPHHEGTAPHTRVALRGLMHDVPEAEARQLLAGNAAELYGADLDLLQGVADRIGPTPEELATPLRPDEVPADPNFWYLGDGSARMTQSGRRMTSDTDGPSILQPRSTEEYVAPARTEQQRLAAHRAGDEGTDAAARTGTPIRRYWAGRRGTAAGLLALNEAAGARYYEVPDEAAVDDEAAEEAFRSDGPVIDVQTHWIENKPALVDFQQHVFGSYRRQAPEWWSGLEGMTAYTLAEYLRCVFVESETAVAVLSSTPGNSDGDMLITNAEMVGIRELFDRMAGTGRLLSHTVVRPNVGDTELMPDWADRLRPSAWKVYTMGVMEASRLGYDREWRLDDDETGFPFLEMAQATGVRRVCAHKGVSGLVASGAPDDVGPAAKAFPDIDFLVYHSGYEPNGPAEVAYAPDGPGVDRLIASVEAAGLGPGCNVYAELGTTWFNLVSKPEQAAHVLGKLLLHFGEDNVLWGTDAIWYGPTQPVLDAFRTFQIPDAMCEAFGYPKLTPAIRRKIVAGNASRTYGIDLDALGESLETEDVRQWSAAVLEEHDRYGLVG